MTREKMAVAVVGMIGLGLFFVSAAVAAEAAAAVSASDSAVTAAPQPDTIKPGEPVATATIFCIGVMWPVEGDANGSAQCAMSYREAGSDKWLEALPLHRKPPLVVDWDKGTLNGRPFSGEGRRGRQWRGQDGEYAQRRWAANYLAGSIFGLKPGTKYQIQLKLTDPDSEISVEKTLQVQLKMTDPGSKVSVEKTLEATTRTEPVLPAEGRKVDVTAEGGAKALAAALEAAKPGDIIVVHKGTYDGPFTIKVSGTAEKPIVIRSAGDGPALIKGTGYVKEGETVCFQIDGSYIFVDGMEFEDAVTAINIGPGRFTEQSEWEKLQASGGILSNIVITHCRTARTQYAIIGTANQCFFADNDLNGLAADVEGIDWSEGEGVEVHGSGTVICYNKMYHLADAVSTYSFTSDQDVYNNDAYSNSDDGIEVDYSDANNRVWDNRFWFPANNGVSFQPYFGGPVYIIRNEVIGPHESCLKDRYTSRDGYFFNNTFIGHKAHPDLGRNCRLAHFDMPTYSHSRNNLYIIQETTDDAAVNVHADDIINHTIDMDYDGLGGIFMISSGNGGRKIDPALVPGAHYVDSEGLYIPIESFQKAAKTLAHYTLVDPAKIFATPLPAMHIWQDEGARPLTLLKEGSNAIDAGTVIPTVTDGYTGKAPDLGAHEFGRPAPHYGPRGK